MKIKKKWNKVTEIVIAIFVIAFFILAIPLAIAYFDNAPENVQDIANSCLNMDVKGSGQCAVGITQGFYKYNLDNAGKKLTFDELKAQGGVCSSWSDYYSEIGKELGFKTRNVIIPVSDSVSHEFSVWSSEEAYCVLDQTDLMCTNLQ
jgi:hypothetical protein